MSKKKDEVLSAKCIVPSDTNAPSTKHYAPGTNNRAVATAERSETAEGRAAQDKEG